MELPFDPDMPIPEDMPEGMKKIMEWAQSKAVREEMSHEDIRNKLREELSEGFTLTQLHLLGKMIDTITDAQDPGEAASFYSGMLTGFGVMREQISDEVCELCGHMVPTSLEEV